MNQTVEPELDGFNRMGKPLSEQGAQPMSIVRQWDLIQRGRGNASAQ